MPIWDDEFDEEEYEKTKKANRSRFTFSYS